MRPLGAIGAALGSRALLSCGRSARISGYWVNCRAFRGFCAGSRATPVIVTRTGWRLVQEFQAIAGCRVDFLATSRVLTAPPGVAVGEGGYYLFLGRYHRNKGIDLLIEAVGRVKARLPPGFCLRVHGFGPLEALIRARVRELGLDALVEIRGPTSASTVSTVLRRARGLIIPSRIESIPLILSDGLQMELPIMVTDVGDMGMLVRRYAAGLVCRPEVDDMAETLLRFVSTSTTGDRHCLRQLLDIRASAERFLSEITAASKRPGDSPAARARHRER